MEIREALTIVRMLADGVHPETGEILQADCLYNHPQAVRALHRAAGTLEFQDERERSKKFLPSNAGKPWSNQEDTQICDELRRGMTFEQIAQIHNRTNGSVPAGQATIFSIDVNPNTGTFPNNVIFSCSKLPALTTCRFSPGQVGSGGGDSLVALTIQTTAPVPRVAKSAFSLLIFVFPLAGMRYRGQIRPIMGRWAVAAVALLLLLLFISCGGGLQGGGGGSGSPGTPPGTYTITITATSDSVTHSTPLSLTVTP
jgi:hypothetical protein